MKILLTPDIKTERAPLALPEYSIPDASYLRLRQMPPEMGFGSMTEVSLRQGLSLFIMDYILSYPTIMQSKSWPSGFSSIFFISGKASYCHSSFDHQIDMSGGINRFSFQPHTEGYATLFPDEPLKVITITMSCQLAREIFGNDLAGIPSNFAIAANGGNTRGQYSIQANTPSIQMILWRISNLSFSTVADKIMLEGLVLELLAKLVQGFKKDIVRTGKISLNEKECCAHARSILLANVANPPHLIDLARKVGLPANRLSQCFKELYYDTPLAFLRETRLIHAKQLFCDTDMNVTEVALAVGYNSLSHFSKSFFRKFGISPRHYKKNGHPQY